MKHRNRKSSDLRAHRADLLHEAQKIIDDSKGADLTAEDSKRIEEMFADVKSIDAELTRREKSAETMAQLNSLWATPSTAATAKSAWGAEVATRLTKTVGAYGVKAITTGGIDVPQVVDPVVVETVEPGRLLDLVSRKPLTGNEFEYLRQTVRTNNADVVADGATKPTSVYTFEDESDKARVVAHLSEAIPLRYLADHEEIQRVLVGQMAEDLYLALESQMLSGDGTGENFTGLANVSGIQTQAYTTDLITTLRKARTALTTIGETPTGWLFNPADMETIDLIREDGTTGGFMDGLDAKVFGNLPTYASSVVPAGTAYLGNWAAARLYIREMGRLDADGSGALFDKNQIKLRYEGRFGFAVLKPDAFVQVDLTAA